MAASTAQALLEPWRETLYALRLSPTHDTTSPSDDPRVWLEWEYPHDDPGALTRALEAVELFTLLERADRAALWQETEALPLPQTSYQWRQYVLETWPVPRVSGYRLIIRHFDDVQPVCEYLAGEATAAHGFSVEYLQVRRALKAAMPRGTPPTVSMVLRLSLQMERWHRVWELLPFLSRLAAIQASSPHGAHRLAQLRTQFEFLDLSPTSSAPATTSSLEQLRQLCRLGVTVSSLPELKLTLTRANAAAFVTTIKEMLGSRQGGYAGRTQRVTFSTKSQKPAAIASAIVDATSIDDIGAMFREAMQGDDRDRRSELYWMAYVLFSRQANADATSVRLFCSGISMSSVAIMEELLVADEPLALLFDDLATSIRNHTQWRLRASRFVLYDPTIPAEENGDAVLDERLYHGLRVLGVVVDWWIVFLPGWGKAWVHTHDAQVFPACQVDQKRGVVDVKRMEELEIRGARDQAATAALLQLVGTNVSTFKLTELPDGVETWCPDLFRICTGFHELHLEGIAANRLSLIFECITRSPTTKLECLMLELTYFSDENLTDLMAVLDALADRQHPLSKQLRRLGVFSGTSMNFGVPIISPELFSRAVHMLDTNKTLEFLRLDLPVCVRTIEQSTRVIAALDQHQHQKLPLAANQLGVREKAAFLSFSMASTAHRPCVNWTVA